MIIHINGNPGIGKLTIALALQNRIGGKVLDNHSVYNVAFTLTNFKSPEFYDCVRSVRSIAYERVRQIPVSVPVILTNFHARNSEWGIESWDEIVELARRRGSQLLLVTLKCSPEENLRRIQTADRRARRKPIDPEMVRTNQNRALLDRGGDRLLQLDVTSLSADAAADEIASWIQLEVR